jgi:hypothetical protein
MKFAIIITNYLMLFLNPNLNHTLRFNKFLLEFIEVDIKMSNFQLNDFFKVLSSLNL